jgi:heat shock protein HslJ
VKVSNMRTILLGLATSLLLAFPVAAADLAGSEWRPTQLGDAALPEDSGLYLDFESGGRLSGHSGCNSFFGSYRLDDGTIEMGPFGATRMACEEPAMARETSFLNALAAAATFERDGPRLTLRDEAGSPLILFVQTDWD